LNFPQFSTYNSQERKPNGKPLYIVFQIAPLSKFFPIFARKVTSAANFFIILNPMPTYHSIGEVGRIKGGWGKQDLK